MLAPTSEGQDKQTRAQAGTHLLDVSAFLTHQRPSASQVPSLPMLPAVTPVLSMLLSERLNAHSLLCGFT